MIFRLSSHTALDILQNRQYRRKRVKHFSRDGSKISFTQDQLYTFDAEASAPYRETDRIVALNMHMNVSISLEPIIFFKISTLES